MSSALILLALAAGVVGIAVAWAITLPVHRFKELRPKIPRDVGSETAADGSIVVPVSAAYRSARCRSCHHECSWQEVAPVLSWFRGCPVCSTPLPTTIPLLQIALPLAIVATVITLGGSWVALPFVVLAIAVAAISVIDLRIWLIPYWMPWAATAAGFVTIAAVSIGLGEPSAILRAALGGVAMFILFLVLFIAAPGKLGFSDVRLAFPLGMFLAWLSPLLAIYGLLFGAVLGAVMGVAALVTRSDSRFPFGPALGMGAMLAVWLHAPILG